MPEILTISTRIIKNTSVLFLSNVLTQAIAFLINIYVARKLGATFFGQFAFAATFASYFMILADPGISTLAQRNLSRYLGKTQEYAGTISIIRIVCSIIALAILILVTITQFDNQKLLLTLTFGIAYIFSSLSLGWVFIAHEKMEYNALLSVISSLFQLLLIYIFTHFTSSLLLFPLALIGANLFSLISGIFLFWKFFGKLKLSRVDRNFWFDFLGALWPFAISSFVITTYFKIGTIIMGFEGGDAEVGLYNAAYKLIFFLQMVGGMYFTSLYPSVSKLFVTSKQALAHLANNSVELCASVGIPILVGGVVFADPIIQWLYAGEFQKSALILEILLIAVTATFLSGTFAYILMACDLQRQYLGSISVSLLLSLILYIVLIPTLGAIGAAIAYVSAELLGLFLVYLYANKLVRISLLTYLYRPILASLGMAIVLLILEHNSNIIWWIRLTTAFPSYFTILWWIGGINKEWIDLLKKVGNRFPHREGIL